MRFDRVLVVAALASLALVQVASSTGFGVNAHIPSASVADQIQSAGIEWVRVDFLWLLAEPERDVYDWSIYDDLVDRLEARGLRIFAGLGATPEWATSGPEFSGVPDDADQWAEFCYLAARRYAGRIHAWGLWNEPNLDRFWEGTRQQYIDSILLPGARSITLGDPTTLVCAPDLAHLSSAHWDDWLRATIRAAGDRLDVVTHHVYPSNGFASEVTYDLETGGPLPFSPPSVKEVLRDEGWRDRPFWLSETGVESGRWGEGRQANFVETLLFQWFAPSRESRNWVDRMFFYEMNDSASPSAYTFGLLYGPPELDPKAAYDAYSQTIADAIVDDAELTSSDVPRFFEFGETVKASVTFRNTGTTPWGSEQLTSLTVEIDSGGWTIDINQLQGDEQVEPGEAHRFSFKITAPGTPSKEIGSNPVLSARMGREGAWPFGDLFRSETVLAHAPPPSIMRQPISQTVVPGASANLHVEATGNPPLSYRWLRNGIDVVDGDLYSGADSPTLVVTALSHEAAAFYQCVVSNDVGDVVSGAASVTIGQTAPRQGGGRVSPNETTPMPPPNVGNPRFSGPPDRAAPPQ